MVDPDRVRRLLVLLERYRSLLAEVGVLEAGLAVAAAIAALA